MNPEDYPAVIPLMGITEVASYLKVTRQRASQLAADHPEFPKPVAVLATGPVFLEHKIREFAKIPRRSGRPKKEKEER